MASRRWKLLRAIKGSVAALTVAAALLLWNGTASAQEAAPAAAGEEQGGEEMEILMNMARFLGQAQSFSVSVRSGYDAIQEDGERIEFGEKRRVLLQRPDRMRVEVEFSDGEQGMVLFDGKTITAFKADDNVYATVEKPGTVDGALVYLVRDLQMTIPLARMFHTGLPQQLEKLIQSVDYVETDALFNVPVDHLAVRTAEVDCQFWITQGAQPLPRRVVITYKEIPGEPQFWAEFSDWNLAPEAAADRFVFTPPAGAEKVPFIIPARIGSQAPPREGGEK
ncbi:DUF2092 domain-containing protein [Desulfuromonas sp. TF]|uniref:DUF2092 domain-containing protein n=1 Tax=Desulfuromonas sp. TF TaxID=1232410 RepID=UPI000488EF4B|nr:DUF2092 domain-containing protein [Desulfuromonas sp. TF]